MRAVGWGGIAALTLLATAASVEAQPPKGKGMPDGWWSSWFGSSRPKPKDEPGPPGPRPPSAEEQARELERIENALMRRDAVCLRLQEIAEVTGNAALRDEAVRLLEMAFALRNRQVQALGLDVSRAPVGADQEAAGPIELPQPSRELMAPLPNRYRSGGMEAGISVPSRSWEGDR